MQIVNGQRIICPSSRATGGEHDSTYRPVPAILEVMSQNSVVATILRGRARRSGWVPANVKNVLLIAEPESISIVSGGADIWVNQKTPGTFDLTKVTTRPTYGEDLFNGAGGIAGDGVAMAMVSNIAAQFQNGAAFWVYVVKRQVENVASTTTWCMGKTTGGGAISYHRYLTITTSGGLHRTERRGEGGATLASKQGPALDFLPRSVCVQYASGVENCWVDGELRSGDPTAFTVDGNTPFDLLTLLCYCREAVPQFQSFAKDEIAAVYVGAGTLSDADRQQLDRYTQRKFRPYDVYIFAGQSNCVGSADVSSLPVADQTADSRVKYWYRLNEPVTHESGGWVDLQGHSSNTKHGAERTFGRDLADAGRKVAIIKYAVNGAGLKNNWLPLSTGGLYEHLIPNIQLALGQLNEGYRLRGVVWIGCESDAGVLANATAIEASMNEFADSVQSDLGTSMPFVMSRLNPLQDVTYLAEAQASQDSWGTNYPGTVVNTDALTLLDQGTPGPTDDIHYDSASQQALGSAIASAALGFVYP